MRVLLLLLLFAPLAFAQDDLEARYKHAKKTNTPAEWLALAESTRIPPLDIDMMPAELRAKVEPGHEKSLKIFREAASHLDPRALAALSAQLRDPEVNAAMIKALRAAKRDDEAAAECRATFAWRTPADVPRAAEACKDCRTAPWSNAPGPATYSVFAQWFVTGTDSRPYFDGLRRGMANADWLRRVRIHSPAQDEPVWLASIAKRDPVGLVIGDGANTAARMIAVSAGIPFIALSPVIEARDSTRSAASFRPFVATPGPDARARAFVDAARRQGVRKLALVLPDDGGDRGFADAIERTGFPVERVVYTAGRREHREDAARVRATRADAIALLGPGEESADWLPFLKGAKLYGTDELDPSGFHDPRLLEGAILVRSRYTPSDTLEWDDASAAAYIAGWAVGEAMARDADSPARLAKALDARATESDASNRWISVPADVARIEVLRVRAGKTEPLP